MGVSEDGAVSYSALIRYLTLEISELVAIRESIIRFCHRLCRELGHTNHPKVLRISQESALAARRLEEAVDQLDRAIKLLHQHAAELGIDLHGHPASSAALSPTRYEAPSSVASVSQEAASLTPASASFDPEPYIDQMPAFVRGAGLVQRPTDDGCRRMGRPFTCLAVIMTDTTSRLIKELWT